MASHECEECKAIYAEVQIAAAEAREYLANRGVTANSLAAWIEGLNEEECARMRESSKLWSAWRRLQEHRALTGHSLSISSYSPISNWN